MDFIDQTAGISLTAFHHRPPQREEGPYQGEVEAVAELIQAPHQPPGLAGLTSVDVRRPSEQRTVFKAAVRRALDWGEEEESVRA